MTHYDIIHFFTYFDSSLLFVLPFDWGYCDFVIDTTGFCICMFDHNCSIIEYYRELFAFIIKHRVWYCLAFENPINTEDTIYENNFDCLCYRTFHLIFDCHFPQLFCIIFNENHWNFRMILFQKWGPAFWKEGSVWSHEYFVYSIFACCSESVVLWQPYYCASPGIPISWWCEWYSEQRD